MHFVTPKHHRFSKVSLPLRFLKEFNKTFKINYEPETFKLAPVIVKNLKVFENAYFLFFQAYFKRIF